MGSNSPDTEATEESEGPASNNQRQLGQGAGRSSRRGRGSAGRARGRVKHQRQRQAKRKSRSTSQETSHSPETKRMHKADAHWNPSKEEGSSSESTLDFSTKHPPGMPDVTDRAMPKTSSLFHHTKFLVDQVLSTEEHSILAKK